VGNWDHAILEAVTLETPAHTPPVTRSNAIIAVGLLTLTNFMSYTDRMLLPALMQPIKREFTLSDTQLGLLSGFAFAIVYAVVGIPVARQADRRSRRTILACALAVWSVMTASCGLARSFVQLVLARVGVGVGEAGCSPTSLSLLSDYFPPHRRGTAVAFFGLGNTLGITAGLAAGGWLGELIGWRGAFVIVGLPGLILAALILAFLREPPRSKAYAPVLGSRHVMRALWSNRAFCWLVAGTVCHVFITYGVVQWLPSFFMRIHGLGLRAAGVRTGATIGLGMAIGTLAGGVIGDRMTAGGLERPQYLCAASMILVVFAYGAAFWADSISLSFACAFAGAMFTALPLSPVLTAILNVCEPGLRATASAVSILTVSLLGVGLAPTVIGSLSDLWRPTLGVESLRYALSTILLMGIFAAMIHLRVARVMREEGFSKASADEGSRRLVTQT
jgi:predicted MFS family arabinose efflux permease